jgi:hypothetical protein
MNRLSGRRAALLSVAALFAVACNGTALLNTEKLQDEIKTSFQQQTEQSVDTVTCPKDQPIVQGGVFQCTLVTLNNETVNIRVTMTDATGNVTWEVVP